MSLSLSFSPLSVQFSPCSEKLTTSLSFYSHIGWHVSQGFALQFVERADEIPDLIDQDKLNSTCSAWSSYQSDNSIVQEDSGI